MTQELAPEMTRETVDVRTRGGRTGSDWPIVGIRKSLVASCVDDPTAIGSVMQFLRAHGAILLEHEFDFMDVYREHMALRVVFELPQEVPLDRLERSFDHQIARRLAMTFRFGTESALSNVTVMVSKAEHGHCLRHLLNRQYSGTLPIRVTRVISNHADLEPEVTRAGIAFSHIPVTRETKPEAEDRQVELIRSGADLVVLARYMQVVSTSFLDHVDVPVINIHHSLLPAFKGADPYRQAKAAGVKMVGATSHYVTPELDRGPIIAQGAIPVSDRDSVADLRRKGAEVECDVLARAVEAHCRNRVAVNGSVTLVF